MKKNTNAQGTDDEISVPSAKNISQLRITHPNKQSGTIDSGTSAASITVPDRATNGDEEVSTGLPSTDVDNDLDGDPAQAASQFWETFGFATAIDPESAALSGVIPEGVIAFVADDQQQIEAQSKALGAIGIVPGVSTQIEANKRLVLYALDQALSLEAIREHFGDRMKVYGPGVSVPLPSGRFFDPEKLACSIDDLSIFDSLDEYGLEGAGDDLPQQISGGTVLDQFSLLGKGADLERLAAKNIPILGGIVLLGQATVVYAPPNSGKTLITMFLLCEAVHGKKLIAAKCYYINADDSQQGLAEKMTILDEVGIHTISPGSLGFTSAKLVQTMSEMIENDDCKDVVIIIDTLKKFVDLMDKRGSAAFGDIVRQFVAKGGTFFAIAHTRKNSGPSGDLVYGGTSDVMEDFDAACLLVPLEARSATDEKLVQFQFKKRRGGNLDECYAYDDNPESSYGAKFASVRLVEDDEQDRYAAAYNNFSDLQMIESIREFIGKGVVQKMALVRAVADDTKVSRRSAMLVLEHYTGAEPDNHHWFFAIKERGAKVYQVHPFREPDE